MKLVAGSLLERQEVELFLERTLIGFTIRSVQYLVPESMDLDSIGQFEGFDQAEAGIVLRGDDSEIHLRWAQEGFTESLWVGASSPGADLWSPHVRRVTVGGIWEAFTGFPIEKIAEGWLPLEGDRESVWSLCVRVNGRFFAIALGEIDHESGTPTYIPDCVVAIFNGDTGRSYHPWAGVASAWAEDFR